VPSLHFFYSPRLKITHAAPAAAKYAVAASANQSTPIDAENTG
jgi:hypothetical protein